MAGPVGVIIGRMKNVKNEVLFKIYTAENSLKKCTFLVIITYFEYLDKLYKKEVNFIDELPIL